jgi:hypothetical protein
MAQAVVAGPAVWRPRFDLGGRGSNPCKFCGGQSVYETGISVE